MSIIRCSIYKVIYVIETRHIYDIVKTIVKKETISMKSIYMLCCYIYTESGERDL